ncbi:hypothetical protein HZZ16_26525 [Bradyrhizobium sp. CNPSo 4016]|nr:hypothetical protein [Bradyrhizobium glycinis]
MTFIAALCHDRISAPWVIGVINGELFTLYLKGVSAQLGKLKVVELLPV